MKDLVISGRTLTRELKIAALCVVLAEGANLYAIVRFGTSWSELLTMLPLALAIAVALYAGSGLLRLLFRALRPRTKDRRTPR